MNIPMFNDNDSYFRHLLDVVEKKELTSNVALHHGYQSDEVLKNFLRSCKLAMFPYQIPHKDWASWGASGAIQLPISLGVPMILSNYPAFQEFKGRIPLVTSPQEAADQIDKIFSDPSYCVTLSESAFAIADERQWDKVAQWYLSTSPNIDFNAPIAIP